MTVNPLQAGYYYIQSHGGVANTSVCWHQTANEIVTSPCSPDDRPDVFYVTYDAILGYAIQQNTTKGYVASSSPQAGDQILVLSGSPEVHMNWNISAISNATGSDGSNTVVTISIEGSDLSIGTSGNNVTLQNQPQQWLFV